MRYEELFSTFPELLREILEEWKLNRELLQEIRIRAGRPVLAVCRNREYQSVKTINRTEMKGIRFNKTHKPSHHNNKKH